MKRLLYVILLFCMLVPDMVWAQDAPAQVGSAICEATRKRLGAPYYYCDCHETSTEFTFPLDVVVSDTMWYTASVEQLRAGLCAYWFADCSVTFEVYAFCTSKAPTIAMTVGANQMRELDAASINRKLDEMGEMAKLMAETLIPRVRIYPNGGTGFAYCYPYNQGPRSTCENPLPMKQGMTYVCDTAQEVYELHPGDIVGNGSGFLRWVQKQGAPCQISLTLDSCTGAEIARATVVDSMHVMVLPASQLQAAKQANQSIFVHVNQASGTVGRLSYFGGQKYVEIPHDTTLCHGQRFVLPDTVLTETTVYPNDTVYLVRDTLACMTYHLTVLEPEVYYDTLKLNSVDLPRVYRNQERINKNGWGDYDFTIRKAGACDERWLLHVEHKLDRTVQELDTTLCQGMTYVTANNRRYTSDVLAVDSTLVQVTTKNSSASDTWVVRYVDVHFQAPDMEYDTVYVMPSVLYAGYTYEGCPVVAMYGEQEIWITATNTCTRWVMLNVIEEEEVTTENENLLPNAPSRVYKRWAHGNIWIVRDGSLYDLLGRMIEKN